MRIYFYLEFGVLFFAGVLDKAHFNTNRFCTETLAPFSRSVIEIVSEHGPDENFEKSIIK